MGVLMRNQLFLERFIYFDNKVCHGRFPNAIRLSEHLYIYTKSAHWHLVYFRGRLLAPLEYDQSHKGFYYTSPPFSFRSHKLKRCKPVYSSKTAYKLTVIKRLGKIKHAVWEI